MMMSTRTRKTMIAEALGEEIEYKTAGNYSVAGIVMMPDPESGFPRQVVAVGTSWDSVTRRTRTASRKLRPGLHRGDEHHVMAVVALTEATAPVVREYFGTHKVSVSSVFTPGKGWEDARYHAGRSVLRKLAGDGVTAVAFSRGNGRGSGRRIADFQMTELLRSMNARSAR
jgi:hypothetical protein